MKILVTAFEPFGGAAVNAAMLAVEALPDRIGPWRLHRRVIPVVFGQAAGEVIRAAEALNADAVLCVGQAAFLGGSRASISYPSPRLTDAPPDFAPSMKPASP